MVQMIIKLNARVAKVAKLQELQTCSQLFSSHVLWAFYGPEPVNGEETWKKPKKTRGRNVKNVCKLVRKIGCFG